MSEKNNEQEALEKFVVNNNDLEELEDKISGLNIFEAIGMHRQEIRHSATLAFLLGPQNPHGLGQYFLKKFLKNVARNQTTEIDPIDLDCADFSDAEVYCEWKKIDILIVCRSAKLIVAIENKIDASEHSDQLSRYSKIIDKSEWSDFKKLFVFLTVDGSEPEKEVDQEIWVSYSHKNLVDILERSLETKGQNLGQDQQVLIRHYIELMRRWILSDSKVAELAQKIYKNHKQAIDLIVEHRPDTVAEIAEKLKQLVNNEDNLKLAHSNKTYIRFSCKSWSFGEEWVGDWKFSNQSGLLFEFENRPGKLKLVLMVLNLKNYKNKEHLFCGFSKSDGFIKEMKTNFPRVWRIEKSLKSYADDNDKIFEEIEKWWNDPVKNNLERLCQKVNEVIDEVGARPSVEGKQTPAPIGN